ncbi:Uncharacterised protein [Vibrio cholerae]|nr:Uncharacterised protein [Vibrio cholerae]
MAIQLVAKQALHLFNATFMGAFIFHYLVQRE